MTTSPPTASLDNSMSQLPSLQSNPAFPSILGRTGSTMIPSISWDRKTLVLGILVVQTSMLHLTLRISRSAGAKPYNAIAAVTYTELIKFLVSLIVFSVQSGGVVKALRIVYRETTTKFRSVSLLLIPAILYSIQNTLVIYAISYLSAAQFSVARQVKIPITGLFSVLLLRKELGLRKWLSIFAVASGVAVVQLAKTHQDSYRLFTDTETESSATKGLLFAIASCFTSGLASVWFEMLLKNKDKVSLWLMNIQLAGFSAIISTTAVLLTADMNAFMEFDGLALLSVSFSASDGLVIALVVKYADNILKGFATSLAICITASVSVLMGDMPFSKELMLGCLIVVSAIGLYGGGSPIAAAVLKAKPHGTI
eukprot:m.220741 g.220741  ORF g.220741 m.220741 type:complete len:368 (-) comp33327_c3_seq3:31-1134(-)